VCFERERGRERERERERSPLTSTGPHHLSLSLSLSLTHSLTLYICRERARLRDLFSLSTSRYSISLNTNKSVSPNFVSARTNRRHHHHLHQWGLSFAQDPSAAKHAHSAHGRAAAKVRVATKTPLRSGTCPPAGTCRIARVMKAPTRRLSKKRAAEELLGRVHLPRLYAVWQAAGAARRPAHLPLWTTGLRREARLLLSRLAVPAARASGSGAYGGFSNNYFSNFKN